MFASQKAWLLVGVLGFSLPAMASAPGSAQNSKMLVSQLSSGADGLVRYEVTSSATTGAPATSGGYVLVVRADTSAAAPNNTDLVPVDSVNFVECANGAGCDTLGLTLTDPSGALFYFGAPVLPMQPTEIAIPVEGLCQVGSLQAGGIPEGCSVSPATISGYAQTGSINLTFNIYLLGATLDQPLQGPPVDQSGKIALPTTR